MVAPNVTVLGQSRVTVSSQHVLCFRCPPAWPVAIGPRTSTLRGAAGASCGVSQCEAVYGFRRAQGIGGRCAQVISSVRIIPIALGDHQSGCAATTSINRFRSRSLLFACLSGSGARSSGERVRPSGYRRASLARVFASRIKITSSLKADRKNGF